MSDERYRLPFCHPTHEQLLRAQAAHLLAQADLIAKKRACDVKPEVDDSVEVPPSSLT